MDYTTEQIAKMIDHSLLQPMLTDDELEQDCQVAVDYQGGLGSVRAAGD